LKIPIKKTRALSGKKCICNDAISSHYVTVILDTTVDPTVESICSWGKCKCKKIILQY